MNQLQSNPTLHYEGSGLTLFFYFLKYLVFTVLTLGVYHFWGKTRIRQYLCSNIYFKNIALKYTAVPLDIFIAVVKFLFVIVAIKIVTLLTGWIPGIGWLIALIASVFFISITPFAIYLSRNYKFKNTFWGEVNFFLSKDIKGFVLIFLRDTLILILTLGLYLPWFINNYFRALNLRSRFGDQKFSYNGKGIDLILDCSLFAILTPVTFGVYAIWFYITLKRYHLEHTTIGHASAKLKMDNLSLFIKSSVAVLLSIITLGIGFPAMYNWLLTEFLNNIEISGDLSPNPISKASDGYDALGEGVSYFLDLDLGL